MHSHTHILVALHDADIDVAIVGDQHLDNAFMEYTHMLGGSPNALTRNYQTGQSVLRSLNGLQGQDETKIFSGVVTRKGYDLYLKILQTMSHGNKHKVSAKSLGWLGAIPMISRRKHGMHEIERESGSPWRTNIDA